MKKIENLIDQLLENPPEHCKNARDLYIWSTNYESEKGTPLNAFLDLIGLSDEYFGYKVNAKDFVADFEAAHAIGEALVDWAHHPQAVTDYLEKILNWGMEW